MVVTTPDTSAVRAWARSNGYDVADRGRLPADLTDAYLAAQGGKAAPAKKAAARKTAARKPAAKKAAPTRKASSTRTAKTAPKPAAKRTAAVVEAPAVEAAPPAAAAATSSPAPAKAAEPKPKPVTDDRRLVALGEQLHALTARVAELEKQVGSKPAASKRFRRSR